MFFKHKIYHFLSHITLKDKLGCVFGTGVLVADCNDIIRVNKQQAGDNSTEGIQSNAGRQIVFPLNKNIILSLSLKKLIFKSTCFILSHWSECHSTTWYQSKLLGGELNFYCARQCLQLSGPWMSYCYKLCQAQKHFYEQNQSNNSPQNDPSKALHGTLVLML